MIGDSEIALAYWVYLLYAGDERGFGRIGIPTLKISPMTAGRRTPLTVVGDYSPVNPLQRD